MTTSRAERRDLEARDYEPKECAALNCYTRILEIAANWAAVLTALIAALAWGLYLCERRGKVSRLETYLKAERDKGDNKGQRTVLNIVAELSMSENDVLDAAFRSKHVRCVTKPDEDGYVAKLLFEYTGE